ncbi:MAG TPA: EAL domain-containing protein [Actinomycetales bacterium]|nr:EAL domain-containing protein [Actinomycetales bacterium]
MARQRSDSEQQLADLLTTAKESLHLSVAFVSRMDGTTQHLEVVESSVPFLFSEGATQEQATTFCQAIWDGKLPSVIPEVRKYPEAMKLPASRLPRIRSYVSVPIVLSDGSRYGTFCAAGLTSDKALCKRDKALMDVLARAASVIIEPGVRERARRAEIVGRLGPLLAGRGPVVLLQPIVDLGTGIRVGAEALSRFPPQWSKAPDVCFAEAHSVGVGDRLELLALERAAEHLMVVPGYVSMNISPATLLTPECADLFAAMPLPRVLLELSEHDPVTDYAELTSTLAPLRDAGMRLAIDDVGAGFSSMRHIVLTAPDVIKLDRSIVAGVASDTVLRTLVRALVDFAHGCDARVVAEGVETADDAATLLSLGVDDGQGWLFGRPAPASDLATAPAPPAEPGGPDLLAGFAAEVAANRADSGPDHDHFGREPC